MTDTNQKKEFTVQRVDPPVSVGVASDRAGSTRRSSSVCSPHLVGDQAGAVATVTGRKQEKMADHPNGTSGTPQRSLKRNRLRLSPTSNLSTLDPQEQGEVPIAPRNVSVVSWLWDEEEGRSVKKAKDDAQGNTRAGINNNNNNKCLY